MYSLPIKYFKDAINHSTVHMRLLPVYLHPYGLVLLNVISSGKFSTNICLPSELFLDVCVTPSSKP